MDSSVKRVRELNPRKKANLLTKVTFLFACSTFRKGWRKDLEEKDIYETMNSFSSATLGSRIENEWDNEKKKSTPRLIMPLIKMFGVYYACLGLVLLIVNTSLMIAKPLLKGKLVSYFSPNQTQVTQADAFYYGGTLITCVLINTVFMHTKSLKLSSTFMSNGASGQAITLITKDVNSFDFAIFLIHKLWVGIIQIMIMTYIMYQQIGVAAIVGASALFLSIPFQAFLGQKTSTYRVRTAEKTDQRVRITQEILTAIRIIKMYTWELFFAKTVNALRIKEIRNLRLLFYLKAVVLSIGQLNARFALYICIITYVALGNHITAEKAFVVTGCFASVRVVLTIFIPFAITQLAELKASLQRITHFLQLEEVGEMPGRECGDEKYPKVCIENVTVKSETDETVLEDVNLQLNPGLTVISGSTGSGKSTLLKVILGDVKKSEGIVDVIGKMSYASQEPWIFPGTIRQNIIFNEWLDEKRYETIVRVCALEKDFDVLPYGDRTCVTDKGLNLSRGQKTRINLARAVYKLADIYLLDDCLSAVDGHVAKHIFYECIQGFLKDKMCILVSHQEQFLREAKDIVVVSGGCIKFHGSFDDLEQCDDKDIRLALSKDGNVAVYEQTDEVKGEKVASEVDDADEATKLLADETRNIYAETKQEGSVNKQVYSMYFNSGGIKMFLLVIVLSIIGQATSSWSDYFVSFWVDMEQEMSGFRFNQTTNSTEYLKLQESHSSVMRQYSLVIVAATVFTLLRVFIFFIFTSKASTKIHDTIFNNILNAGMTFFDTNLSGNVLNRFSRDLGIIDENLPYTIFDCSRITLMLLGILFVVSSVNPIFLIPSAVFMIILYFARRMYIPTGRSIRRLEGATRSPMIGHFNATLEGLTTIRANEAQPILKAEFDKHQDLYNSAVHMHLSTTRAFGFYLDTMCDVYVSLITLSFLVFKTNTLAGRVGLAITQAFSLSGLLQWGVRQWSELENQMTCTERVLEYKNLETEEKSGDKIPNWPSNGKIIYNEVNLRYSPTSERVLKDINVTIESKHKVGVVGRTGAGKTSIISTLFRMYEFRGAITIDGVDITSVDMQLLRSSISIIPQDPVLFSGTLRTNLDPNGEYTDKDLWDALEEVEMKDLILNLNANISEGGSNFSVGQRQLICLARAIVRNNIILVLDEATANIDPQTDVLIQRTIRKKFSNCTVITIAHRLNTIMDSDRVLVMDLGNVIEYDHPNVLLSNKKGAFYKMVKEAGLL